MEIKKENKLLIENAAQLLTMRGESSHDIGMIENGSVYVVGNKIKAIGTKEEVAAIVGEAGDVTRIDATGKVVSPGFVDCHTHIVFGGSRVAEYSIKLTDDRPETLQRFGIPTGMNASVGMTKNLPVEELAAQTEKRMRSMLINGTTTIESKSGYAFTMPDEMKMLEVNRLLSATLPMDIVPTFLGGHGWDESMGKEKYLDYLCKEMIPQIARFHMASFNDVWCDEGNYTVAESERILRAGMDYGLIPTIHSEAYSYIGGADVAIDLKAASAGHLNYTPVELFPRMRDAGVVGIVIATTDYVVQHQRPVNPRPMLDCGMDIAIATNCNPGCWIESMQFAMDLATRRHRISPAEAFRAATYGGAKALTLTDRGVLDVEKVADILIFDVSVFQDIFYKHGTNHVETVVKSGEVVVQNGRLLEKVD